MKDKKTSKLMYQPLVSIAVLSFNNKKYLKECLESIISQDYKNIEIVVGDDASTDGSVELLEEYSKIYNNIKIITHLKNVGITVNSNDVHFACTGKYISWMGGDDLMLPGKISKQVEYMEKNADCTMTYHDLEVFQSETEEVLYYFNSKFKKDGDVKTQTKYGTFNGACSVMIRRDKAPESGFDTRIPVASDYLFWVETLSNGGKIHYIDEVLGKYRRHYKNVTSKDGTFAKQGLLDHFNSINIIIQKYPHLLNEALYRYASLLLAQRNIDKKFYFAFVTSSLKVRVTKNALGACLAYIFSFGKIRL